MADDLNTEIKIGADASGVEAGVSRAKRSLADLGASAQKAGKDAAAGVASVGAGGDKAAKDVERATKSMQNSLQRLLAEQKAGAKGSREYWEALADTRGISRNAIKPILDQIDAAKAKTLQAKAASESWQSSLSRIGPLVAAAFSGAALTSFIGKVVSVQREFDVLYSSLKTVTGSGAAAERELEWLKDFAKTTPFGLAQATQGFVKMKALGLDPTRAALTSFGNTASAMGKDLNQMIEAVADASTGEFERLKEFGIKAKKEGDSVSLTFQGVTTTIRNSATEITKYLQGIGDTQFGGAMEERAKTLDGTIAALGDTWDELFRTVSQRNVGSLIFDSVTLANGALEDATTILKAMGGAAGDAGRETGALAASQNGLAMVFETIAVLGSNVNYVLTQTGITLGGFAAKIAAIARGDLAGNRAIGIQMKEDWEAARAAIDATERRIMGARKAQEEYNRYATRNASAATDPRRIDLGKPGGNSVAAPSKPGKAELSEYDKLIQKLGQEIPKAAAEAEAAQMGYNKAQTEFLVLAASPVWASFTNQQRATVAALFENKIASEEAADSAKTIAKANIDAAQAREKYLASLNTGIEKIRADILAQEEATARMGLSREAIADLDAAKLGMLATDLELQAIKALDRNLDQQTYDSLKEQAKLYRDLAAAKRVGAAKETALDIEKANEEAAKKATEDWQRASDEINRSLTDALLRGFESGKGFAENLRDTVKNMFSTLVLRPVVSAFVNPVAGAVNSALYGGTASGILSGVSGVASGANVLTGLQGTTGILGNIGTFLGTNTVASNAALASSIGIDAASASAAATGASAAGGGSGIMGAINSIPGWGWALAGVAVLGSMLSKKQTLHSGAGAIYSAETGLQEGAGIYNLGTFGMGDVREYNKDGQALASGIAAGLGSTLDGIAKAFGQKAGFEVATAFADDTSKDGAWGALRISQGGKDLLNWQDTRTSRWAPKEFADGAEGQAQYLAAIANDTRQVLLDMDLPEWADTMLTRLGELSNMDQLSAAVAQIAQAQTAFEAFGQYMPTFAGLADSAIGKLVDASGGVQAVAGNMATFVELYTTDAEKLAVNTENVRTALEALGMEMPATREEFAAQVKANIALGDAGAKTVAGLLAVSGAFASVTQAAEAAAQAERERASTLRGSFGSLAQSLSDMRGGVAAADARVAAVRMDIWSGYADAQQKVIDLEKQAADATRSFAQSLRGFVSDLTTGPNSGLGLDARYQMLGQQFSTTAARAGAGDQSARDALTGVASAYLDVARANARTSVEYARDAARVSIQLNKLATAAESDPLVQKYDAQNLTLQQQIADAQIDVVKYLALMEATGTSTDLGIQIVDKTLAQLRDEYVGATQAQAEANLKLDVALAALDALGLTESLVNAIAANQTNSLSAALNITDEALASITGALGLTPENVSQIGQQFGTEVALLVGQAATDLAAAIGGALAFDPAKFDALRTIVGYDTSSPNFEALHTILGFDLESDKFRSLQTILGMSSEASAQVDALMAGIGFAPDAAGRADALAGGIGFTGAAVGQLDLIAGGLGISDALVENVKRIAAGVSFSGTAQDQINTLASGVSLSSVASAQVNGLLSGLTLSPAAAEQVGGLLDGLKLSAVDRVTIERMLGGIGFDPDTSAALQDGLGLQQGLLPMLGTALGLSAEAQKAIGVLSGMGTIDQTVRNAYAMVGRSGIGTDVSQIDQQGYDYWTKSLATGAVSMSDFTQQFLLSAAGAPDEALRAYIAPYMKKLGIPGFAVGTNYVPQDMLAQIHEGEAIVPKAYNPAAGGVGNADVVAELRRVNDQLARVTAELSTHKAELQAIKGTSNNTSRVMAGIESGAIEVATKAA